MSENTEQHVQSMTIASQRQPYHDLILQKGMLPLCPNRTFDRTAEHRCTTTLIWPEHSSPRSENTILIDPCFTTAGYQYALKQLKTLDISFKDIGYMFITHRHIDHVLTLPEKKKFPYFQKGSTSFLPDIDLIPCPGHAQDLQALVFRSTSHEQVWIVGDAILNLRWLTAWQYYWPNVYTHQEVVQTWNSVAHILSQADIVIPGHGEKIYITAALLTALLETFPSAEHADKCPEVEPLLWQRQQQLLEQEAQSHATFSDPLE